MPFDGTSPARAPLPVLPEAERRPTKFKHPRRAPSPEKLSQRLATESKAIMIFDAMEQLFDGGAHWGKGHFYDGEGRYCLVGALRHISDIQVVNSDSVTKYLKWAVEKTAIEDAVVCIIPDIEGFNDGRKAMPRYRRSFASHAAWRSGRQTATPGNWSGRFWRNPDCPLGSSLKCVAPSLPVRYPPLPRPCMSPINPSRQTLCV